MSVRDSAKHHRHRANKCNEKNNYACSIPICVNAFSIQTNGIANSFKSALDAMDFFRKVLKNKRKLMEDTLVIAVGLGKCDQLYKGDIHDTELILL